MNPPVVVYVGEKLAICLCHQLHYVFGQKWLEISKLSPIVLTF